MASGVRNLCARHAIIHKQEMCPWRSPRHMSRVRQNCVASAQDEFNIFFLFSQSINHADVNVCVRALQWSPTRNVFCANSRQKQRSIKAGMCLCRSPYSFLFQVRHYTGTANWRAQSHFNDKNNKLRFMPRTPCISSRISVSPKDKLKINFRRRCGTAVIRWFRRSIFIGSGVPELRAFSNACRCVMRAHRWKRWIKFVGIISCWRLSWTSIV